MLIHWLCFMIKIRQLKICLDTQVYSSKLECSAVANGSKVRYKKKSRKYFLYGCDNAHRISGSNTFQLFFCFFFVASVQTYMSYPVFHLQPLYKDVLDTCTILFASIVCFHHLLGCLHVLYQCMDSCLVQEYYLIRIIILFSSKSKVSIKQISK